MSDSTAHNLKVMGKVCEDEGVENNTLVFLYNIHPLMIFQRKIKEFLTEPIKTKNYSHQECIYIYIYIFDCVYIYIYIYIYSAVIIDSWLL